MKQLIRTMTVMGMLAMPLALTAQSISVEKSKPTTVEKEAPTMEAEVVEVELTTIDFAETSFDFGKIEQGEKVRHSFSFVNSGENDLILENVKPSCGCTAIDWPRDPIAPGESAEIEAQFNSAGKMGKQHKYITIIYNGDPKIERVTFTGEVVAKGTK